MTDRKPGEPLAYMRKWAFDKTPGTPGNRPKGWAFHETSVHRLFDDDVPLYAAAITTLAAEAGQPAPVAGVAVKPLEWQSFGSGYAIAETILGQTAVQGEPAEFSPNRWGWWSAGSGEDDEPSGYADGREAAKAAAQADYDARIRSALAPAPDVTALVDRLVEALDRLTTPVQKADFASQMRDYDEAHAALAAARAWKEGK